MKKITITLFILITSIQSLASIGIEDAPGYHKNSHPQWNWALEELDTFSFKGTEKILDIGCGDGKITSFISDVVKTGLVIGCDASKEMIHFATREFPPSEHKNLIFMLSDASNLPFVEQFDTVVSFYCLHWVLDQVKALSEIEKVLIPGGYALIVVPAKAPNAFLILCESLIKEEKWSGYFPDFKKQRAYFDQDEYEQLLIKAHLKPIHIINKKTESHFANHQALFDFLKP